MKYQNFHFNLLKDFIHSIYCYYIIVFASVLSFTVDCHAQMHPSWEARKNQLDSEKSLKSIQSTYSHPSSYGDAYGLVQKWEYIRSFHFSVDENKGEIQIWVDVVITTGVEKEYGSGEYVNVWIDWEGDGLFGSNDQVLDQLQYAKAVGFKGVLNYVTTVRYPGNMEITDETWIRASLGYSDDPLPSDIWTWGSSITKPIALGEADLKDVSVIIQNNASPVLKSTSATTRKKTVVINGQTIDPYYGIANYLDFTPIWYIPKKPWEGGKRWENTELVYIMKAKWPGKKLSGKVELWQKGPVYNYFDSKIADVGTFSWKKGELETAKTIIEKFETKVVDEIKIRDEGSYYLRWERDMGDVSLLERLKDSYEILNEEKGVSIKAEFDIDRCNYYINPEVVYNNGKIEMQSCIHKELWSLGWKSAGLATGAYFGAVIGAQLSGGPPVWAGTLCGIGGSVLGALLFTAAEHYWGAPFGWEVGDFAWYYDWKIQKYAWNGSDYDHKFDIHWHKGNWYRNQGLMGYGYWFEGPGWHWVTDWPIDIGSDRSYLWWQNKLGPLEWPPMAFKRFPNWGYGKESSPLFPEPPQLVVNVCPIIYPYDDHGKFKIEKKEQFYEITVWAQDHELGGKHLTFNWQHREGSIIGKSDEMSEDWDIKKSTIQWVHPGDGQEHKISVVVSDNLNATAEAAVYINPDDLKSTGHSTMCYTDYSMLDGGILINVTDQTIDTDNNGLHDTLNVGFTIDLSDLDTEFNNGAYILSASLFDANTQLIAKRTYYIAQADASETIQLPFIGRNIHTHGEDGPYYLSSITLEKIFESGVHFIAFDDTDYPTSNYSASEFESMYFSYAGNPTDIGVDINGDGMYDHLRIAVDVEFDKSGTYSFHGQLYDLDSNLIAPGFGTNSVTSNGISTVHLLIDGVAIREAMSDGPYQVSNLVLIDSLHNDVSLRCDDFITNSYESTEFQTNFAEFSGQYNEMTLDINEDGLYDSLMISTRVSVSTAGLYYVSAALMKNDTLIILESSFPVNLLSGANTINFAFDGKTIGELGMDGPYYFTGLTIWNEEHRHVLSPDIQVTDLYLASSFQKEALILKGNYTESTNDEDSDGKIDHLMISFELETITGGQYEINAMLASGTGDLVSGTSLHTALTQGDQTLNLTFDGQGIALSGIDGSYDLTLSAWDTLGNLIFYIEDVYTTSAYTLAQFESLDAVITENYTESAPDVDEDGYHDSLLVDVELSVSESGTYLIRGECLDTTLQIIHEAEVRSSLNTGTHSLRLAFDGKEFFKNGVDGPYILGNLFLYRIEGENWNNLDVVDFAYATEDYGALEFQHTDAYLADEYKDFGLDHNENGLYDVLVVEIGLHVESSGNYRIQGQLYDNKGYYIETASIEDSLAEGYDTVSFEFSGGRIRGHGNASPYHLRYVRIFGENNQVLQSVDDAHTTKLYNADQFEMSESDLIIYSTEVVLQEGKPDDNIVTLKAKVYNFGGTRVDSVLVKFYSWNLGLNELKPLYNLTGEVPGEVGVDLTFPSEDSIYYFALTVDPQNSIPEMSEMNNESHFGVQTPLADFPEPTDEISIVADADSVMLNWSAVTGSNSGFNIYRKMKGDADYQKLNSMLHYDRSFVDTSVIGDTVYHYAVASYLVSAPSLEGAFSEEAYAETRKIPVELSQNEYTAPANGEIVIPVGISDLKGNSISSVSLKISVNPNVLECVEASIAGAAEGWTDFIYDCNANGEIRINMSGAVPLSGNGTLVEVKYRVTGSIGDTSSIRIIDCILNNGLPQVKTAKALVTVGTPSRLPSQPGSVQVELRNYPNPFSRSTTIEYTHPDLQAGTRVILDVYNLNMVKVTSHVKHMHMAGTYRERWDGCDFDGNHLPSGMYIYRLKAGKNIAYGRMMIIE